MIATNGKSIECELLQLSVKHYHSTPSFINLIKNKIEYFSDSQDINLNIIGFRGLRILLLNKPELLSEYSELLAKKAKVEDAELATEIFSVYAQHLSKEDAPTILTKMNELLEKSQVAPYKEALANAALKLALREPDVIPDWSEFVKNFLPEIIQTNKVPEKHASLLKCLKKVEKHENPESLAPFYESAVKSFSSCTSDPAIHMTLLLCRHASAVEDTAWLDQQALEMSEQGGLAVDCLVVGSKVETMEAGESEAGEGDELRYLLEHPELRESVKKIVGDGVD